MKRHKATLGAVVSTTGSIFYDDDFTHDSKYIRKGQPSILVLITALGTTNATFFGVVLESPYEVFPPGTTIEFFIRNAMPVTVPIAKIRTRGQTNLPII